MIVYIVYFFLILIVPTICSAIYNNREKAQATALRILIFLMYLMLALKAETVGCDIRGYGEWYQFTGTVPFNDFSYCYMEKGYMLLMKIGNIIGLSFQAFEALLYAIAIIPLYYFIKNNSTNVMISVLILFCLDYFVFACSGLRQAVAMSLCAGSFTYLTKAINVTNVRTSNKYKALFLSLLIVFAASQIHRSALLFIPALFIVFFQYKAFTYLVYASILLILLFERNFFFNFNEEYDLSRYELDDRLTLGMMFVFDVAMFIFYLISTRSNKKSFNQVYAWQYGNVIVYGFVLMLAFNGSMLLRSSLYEIIFLAIIMPDAIESWEKSTRGIITAAYVVVMFLCLYFLILEPNTLRIVPYRFFFQ